MKSSLRGLSSASPISLLESNSIKRSMEEEISNVALLTDAPTNITTHKELEEQVTDLFKLGSLRSSMSKAAFDATPFGSSVKRIMDLIEKTMMPKVLEAHTANQNELLRLAEDVDKCGATKSEQVAKANKRHSTYLRLSPLHRTCRAGEAGLSTERSQCHDEEDDKKKIMELKCKEFAMVKKQVGDQTANKQIMKKGGSESDESYVNRISETICGNCRGKGCTALGEEKEDKDKPGPRKKCGYEPYTCGCGFRCQFAKAKDACEKASEDHRVQVKKCRMADKQYFHKKAECDSLQDQMDSSSCKRAVEMKDACEAYAECHFDKKNAYLSLEKMVKQEEKDRQGEWRGLMRMQCLIKAFTGGKVTSDEVVACKKQTHSTAHLVIKYPKLPKLVKCSVPVDYPNTPSYKRVNFAPLPALAKGKQDSFQCTGLLEVSTTPAKGSPKTCSCTRVTLNGPYSPGPLVKCVNCKDVRRSLEKNSCPEGTKLFSPRSRTDWKTFLASAPPLRAPNWIIDITRPQNGCGGCKSPMNSKNIRQRTWTTSDNSPWWLRSAKFTEPSGDYHANCYMDLWSKSKRDENSITFNDQTCNYHAKSYYCQPAKLSLTPKKGSPRGCICKQIALNGIYSAGSLIRCDGCLRVSRALQKNSCPVGTKIFSPRSRSDWTTFMHSATPLRSPNWIVDVTQPQNGCGGCTRSAMSSRNPAQATWRTSDGSSWWLRSSKYSEPNGDYHANCYLDLGNMANENSVTFNDNKCKYNSNSYYCQPAKTKLKPRAPAPPPPPSGPPVPEKGGTYKGYKCAKGLYTGTSTGCDHFTGLTQEQCSAKCKKSASAMDKQSCDKATGVPNCVAYVYNKKMKLCMLYRACTRLTRWAGHPDIVTKLRPSYNPQARTFKRLKNTRCNGKPYTQPKGVPKGPKGITVKQCWDLCYSNKWVGDKDVPVKKCVAMAFYANDGYCDLYDQCEKTTDVGGVLTLKKVQPFFPLAPAVPKAPAPAKKDDDNNDDE